MDGASSADPVCARARSWMNDFINGRVNSFEEIARSENKVGCKVQ
jgi:hypothetical protein